MEEFLEGATEFPEAAMGRRVVRGEKGKSAGKTAVPRERKRAMTVQLSTLGEQREGADGDRTL